MDFFKIKIKIQVDAFTDEAFKGNPAVVCMLSEKKEEEWLQSVATEFNLSETCYLTPIVDVDSELKNENPTFQLRWFTPVAEVKKIIMYFGSMMNYPYIMDWEILFRPNLF